MLLAENAPSAWSEGRTGRAIWSHPIQAIRARVSETALDGRTRVCQTAGNPVAIGVSARSGSRLESQMRTDESNVNALEGPSRLQYLQSTHSPKSTHLPQSPICRSGTVPLVLGHLVVAECQWRCLPALRWNILLYSSVASGRLPFTLFRAHLHSYFVCEPGYPSAPCCMTCNAELRVSIGDQPPL